MSPRLIRSGLTAAVLAVVGGALSIAPTQASPVREAAIEGQQTRTLTREFGVEDGDPQVVDERRVTVRVDNTDNLQGRERIKVSWSGAHPSGGRASNPFGEGGVAQEYPVVILQCRGLDDPSLPAAKQISPSTCWTTSRMQRSQVQSAGEAVWSRDLFATDAEREAKTGVTPYPGDKCSDTDPATYGHITPFTAAGGKVYTSCTAETMAPEAAVGAAFPAAEQAAFTGTDGTGSTLFEVRSDVENESLGCSAKVACSLVVIPIMGISCMAKDDAHATVDRNCRRAGQFLPGSSNFANQGVDQTVSPLYWWSASNWRNRFSFPLSFGLPPNACDILDDRAPTPFYGSELLSQAALQWAPAYCLRENRFKWQQNSMPDDAAFDLMLQGEAAAAEVSGLRQGDGTTRVGYAPTAITGFSIAYLIDKPDNAGEITRLRLNARLLAKLLTESYPATDLGAGRPGIGGNPRSINQDPEFKALNPGIGTSPSESASTLAALSTSSDVMTTLTSYIAADKDAMSFINGKADPWGMKVNPSYRRISMPRSQWPLRDTYVPPSNLECLQQNPAPYLPQIAAPVNNLLQIATALLDAWPLVATQCTRATPEDPWKLGRVDRQGMGSRFMLGLTTLGDAARFGLRTAELATDKGTYVAPDSNGLRAAVALAEPRGKLKPFKLDLSTLRASRAAYPATMIVYTAARLSGMDKDEAAKVAQFIEVSSTEGQVPGRGNGQLPLGYLPMVDSGPTKPLLAQARAVAAAVRAQKKPRVEQTPEAPPSDEGGPPEEPGDTPVGPVEAAPPPVEDLPVTAAPADAEVALTDPITGETSAASSKLGNALLPGLLALGVFGLVVSGFMRLALRQRGVR